MNKKFLKTAVITVILMLGWGINVNAAWLEKYPVTVKQQDGTILELFVTGDEYHHRVHDKEGYTLLRNSEGWVVYAALENDLLTPTNIIYGGNISQNVEIKPNLNISGEAWRQLRKQYADAPKQIRGDEIDIPQRAPVALRTGTMNNIVIYISFPDGDFTYTKNDIEDYFTNPVPSASLFSYFRDISDGNFNVLSTFYPYSPTNTILSYVAPNPRSHYEISNDDQYGRITEHTLLRDAIEYCKNEIEAILSANDMDYDNDGYVDNINFVIQGNPGAWSSLLWPHKWSLYTYNDVELNGKWVWDYNLLLENHLMTVGNGKQSVLVHETYHTLGAPDLYVYYGTEYDITPVGSWGVMASNTVPPQSSLSYITCFSGNFIADIPEIAQSGFYTLYDSWDRNGNPVAYKIASPTSTEGEFFVLEYRRKNGGSPYDSQIPDQGIVITRINPTIHGNAYSNGTTTPFGVYVYRQNGTYTDNGNLSNAVFSSTGLTSFSDVSSPNAFLSDNSLGLDGIVIDNFSAAGGETMTFRVSFTNEEATITASAGANGNIDPSGTVMVIIGEDQTFTFIPDECYEIDTVFVNGEPVTIAGNTYTFYDVQGDSAIHVTFKEKATVTITATSGENGSIDPEGVATITCGGSITYTFEPDECYEIDVVLIDDVPNPVAAFYGYHTFENVTENHTISVFFRQIQYTVFATAGPIGTIEPAGNVLVDCDSSQTFTFTPHPCYVIDYVLIDGEIDTLAAQNGTHTFENVSENHSIYVVFLQKQYTVTASAGENGTIDPEGETTVLCGENFTFNFIPDECYEADTVFVNGEPIISYGNSYTFYNVTEDLEIYVVFRIIQHTVTATSGANGTIDPEGAISVTCGEDQTFTFIPDDCYGIDTVFVNGTPVTVSGDSYTFTNVTENQTIYVNFYLKQYTITASAGANGTITPSGILTFDCGDSQTYYFTPNPGYEIDLVIIDGYSDNDAAINGEYTFDNIHANHVITVTFKPETFKIKVIADPDYGGWVTGNHPDIDTGIYWTVNAYPLNNYVFVEWTENGVWVSDSAEYTFLVEGSRTLTAHFELVKHSIILIANTNDMGWVAPTGGSSSIPHGTSFTIEAHAYPYFTFVNWTDKTGQVFDADSVKTFIVTYSDTLTANFSAETYNITVDVWPQGSGSAFGGGYNLPFMTDTCVWAVPLQCWEFDCWKENDIMIDVRDTLPIQVIKSRHLVAHFKPQKFDITFESDPGGVGLLSGGGTNIPCGEETTVQVDSYASNYDFSGWFENDSLVWGQLVYPFTVTRSRHLVAKFTLKTFDIYVEANPPHGGDVFENMFGVAYDTDTSVLAVAHPHFTFWKWTENDSTVCSDPYFPFSASHSCTLVAHFIADMYEINVWASPPTAGEVFGGGTYAYLTNLTVSAVPDSCHYFTCWTENGDTVSTIADYNFDVEEPRDLVAHFERLTFNITTIPIPGGGGTFTGNTPNIPCGEEITICANPNTGYVFDYWTDENGDIIETDSCITLTVPEDRELTAHFTYLCFYIDLHADTWPYGWVEGDTACIPIGEFYTAHAFANPGYMFDKWTENGITVSLNADYEFEVTAHRVLTAHFTAGFYSIELSVSPISPAVGGTVIGDDTNIPYGEWRTIEAYPNPHFEFVNWTENGVPLPLSAVDSFPVHKNYDLVANFALETYSINITVEGDGHVEYDVEGGYSLSHVPYGTTVTLFPISHWNSSFSHWSEDSISQGQDNPLIFMVQNSRNLVAHFTPRLYNINLYAVGTGGSVHGEGAFPLDTMITVEAVLENYHEFGGWWEFNEKVWDSLLYEFPVTDDRDLYAHFSLARYDITLQAYPEWGGTVDGADTYTYGDTAIVTAYENPYFTFQNWTEDGIPVCVTKTYKFPVDRSRHLVANFTSVQHLVTVKAVPAVVGGAVEGGGYFYHNATDTLKAIPKIGYEFEEWRDDDADTVVSYSPEYVFNVVANRNFTAYFVSRFVDVITSSDPIEGGGTSGGGLNLPIGTEVTVKAFPYPEYQFVNWTIDDIVVDTMPEYTFIAMETCHLVAHFTKNRYTISLFADPPYLGTVSGGGEFPYGDTITVRAHPFAGYGLVNWTEDSVPVYYDADYTFVITGNRTLTAHFDIKRYHVIVESNDTLYGLVTGGGIYDYGDPVTIKAFVNPGYRFANWRTIDSVFVTTALTYTFEVTEDVHFVANFYGLDFDTYAATLWDNTFMLNFNKLEEDKYYVVGCKWFKNDIELTNTNTIDEFSYSAGPNENDLLELAPAFYTYRLTLGDGTVLHSTKKILTKYELEHAPPPPPSLFIYPNPTYSGNMFTIEGTIPGEPIHIFSQTGVFVKSVYPTGKTTTLSLELPAGIYLIRNGDREGKVTVVR